MKGSRKQPMETELKEASDLRRPASPVVSGCLRPPVLTSLGMCPWYQPWLLMSAALSFSSSSSSLRSFSGGDSSRYLSLENWEVREHRFESQFPL